MKEECQSLSSRRVIIPLLLAAILLTSTAGSGAETNAGSTARLIELTAVIKATNESRTSVDRFIFRVTVPPDMAHQRVMLPLVRHAVRKTHKNGIDQYFELSLEIPCLSTVTHDVKFIVLLQPADYTKTGSSQSQREVDLSRYLQPSRLIESDAPEVRAVADSLFAGKSSQLEKAKAAYEYPAKVLKFKPQPTAGALKALHTGSGDCTEFAALFCALCRSGGIPARMTGVFNLGTKRELLVSEPNHNAAEVFLAGQGWVPVDPNLGGGRYDRAVGFAKTGNSVILLNREGAWVWSTWLPPDGFAAGRMSPVVKAGLSWRISVVKEGPAPQMLVRFAKRLAGV